MATVSNKAGHGTVDAPVAPKPYMLPLCAKAKLPAANKNKGGMYLVTDTNKPAYSDGTAWKYMDNSAV